MGISETQNSYRVLITGASGFLGSFITEEALRRGMQVWVVVRRSSSMKYLQDERIHFVYSDLSSANQLAAAIKDYTFDYVIHAAGATKALKEETYYRVNTDGTKNLCNALKMTNQPVKRLVFISSLSVFGPAREQKPFTEIMETDTPQPNTAYGKSKLAAEKWLRNESGLPFTILRPTGIYGPREKDYMIMADSIRKGVDVAVGYTPQELTFVFVKDVVQAVFLAMESANSVGKAYFLSDGETYSSKDFSNLIRDELGKRFLLRPTLPLWVLRMVCAVSDVMMHLTGKLSVLNNDHYNILAQRNWRCDITPARRDLGYNPQWNLKKGVHEMLHDA